MRVIQSMTLFRLLGRKRRGFYSDDRCAKWRSVSTQSYSHEGVHTSMDELGCCTGIPTRRCNLANLKFPNLFLGQSRSAWFVPRVCSIGDKQIRGICSMHEPNPLFSHKIYLWIKLTLVRPVIDCFLGAKF